jgi:hypothetical protein
MAFAPTDVRAQSDEVRVGNLTLSNIWARATPPNATTAAAYITITNNGSMMDMISSLSSKVAKKVEFHQSKMEDGIMKMEHVGHAAMFKPGDVLEMAPGGYHIMFMKLQEKLVDGETMTLSITFKNAGTVELEVPIRKTQ